MKKQLLVFGVMLVLLASVAMADGNNSKGKKGSGFNETHGQETGFNETHGQETGFNETHGQETGFNETHGQETGFNETHGQGALNKTGEKAQEKLSGAAERVLDYIERLQDRIGHSPMTSDEQKASLTAGLEGQKAYFEGVQDEIGNASDIGELRNLSKGMRDEFKDLRANLRIIVGNIWTAHLDNIITRLENASSKLEDKISQLSGSGNTSRLEGLMDDLESKLQEANDLKDQAEEKLGEITDWESAQTLFHDARDLVTDSLKSIRDARQLARDIITGIRGLSGSADDTQVLSTGDIVNTTSGGSEDDQENEDSNDSSDDIEDSNDSSDDIEDSNDSSDDIEDSNDSSDDIEED